MLQKIINDIQTNPENEQAKLELINKFTPLIQKYNRKFFSEDITSKLIIKLLVTANKLQLENFIILNKSKNYTEKAIFNYIKNTLHNKYCDLVKKAKQCDELLEKEKMLISTDNTTNYINSNLHIQELFNQLTPKQKLIFTELFLNNKTQKQISQEYNLSKQTISNTYKRGLQILRKIINPEY